jgi:hypothetical protein
MKFDWIKGKEINLAAAAISHGLALEALGTLLERKGLVSQKEYNQVRAEVEAVFKKDNPELYK